MVIQLPVHPVKRDQGLGAAIHAFLSAENTEMTHSLETSVPLPATES